MPNPFYFICYLARYQLALSSNRSSLDVGNDALVAFRGLVAQGLLADEAS